MRKNLLIIASFCLLTTISGCTKTETKTIVKKHYVNKTVNVYKEQAIIRSFNSREKCQNFINGIKNINKYNVSVSTSSYVSHTDTNSNNGALDEIELGTKYTATLIKK